MTVESLPIELRMLAWATVLGLVQLFAAAALMTRQRGVQWNAGARDGVPTPLTGIAGRLDRAQRNFLETFPLFAATALAVALTGRGDAMTALGAQLYFWARVVYVPIYAAGISYVRSLVWVASVAGMLLVLRGLL